MRRNTGLAFAISAALAVACGTGAAPDSGRIDATVSDAADATIHTGIDAPSEHAPDVSDPCALCGAGQVCQGGRCLDDCRMAGAMPCAPPLACDFLAGHCVDPSVACSLTGEVTPCGSGEFPVRCGPGTTCDAAAMRCIAATTCTGVQCDATNTCRGTGCSIGGGGVRGIALAAPTVAAAGTPSGLRVSAMVTADALCGLNVTFELRRDDALYLSAGNDMAIWRVGLGGARTNYVTSASRLSGVTADRTGALYYVLTTTGEIMRVTDVAGTPTSMHFASVGAPVGGRGVSRLTFGPDGQLYVASGSNVSRIAADGTAAAYTSLPASANGAILTGLVFDADGSLLMATIREGLYRLAVGSATPTLYAPYTSIWPVAPGNATYFFAEALILGPDHTVRGSSFPSDPASGLIFRVDPGPTLTRETGLAEIRAGVPNANYAGIHGMAYGSCGALYFVNQNTSGNTHEAFGQLLVRGVDGSVQSIAGGFNFDWPDGFDGDLVMATVALGSTSSPVRAGGGADATLDVPSTPGCYGLRALVTDPRTGAIYEARQAITVM